MTREILKKIRYVSMFAVIVALILGNFFHSFLMGAEQRQLANNPYGACHAHESSDNHPASSQKDFLPCCASKDGSDATVYFTLLHLNALSLPFSTYFNQAVPHDAGTPVYSPAYPPDQVALDKIILRI